MSDLTSGAHERFIWVDGREPRVPLQNLLRVQYFENKPQTLWHLWPMRGQVRPSLPVPSQLYWQKEFQVVFGIFGSRDFVHLDSVGFQLYGDFWWLMLALDRNCPNGLPLGPRQRPEHLKRSPDCRRFRQRPFGDKGLQRDGRFGNAGVFTWPQHE